MIQARTIYRVAAGEAIQAKLVVVGYPVILRDTIDRPPAITCERFAIVTNQMNACLYSGGDVQYDRARSLRTFAKCSASILPGSPFSIGPQTDGEERHYHPIHPETWTPLIDTATWCKRVPKFRGEGGCQAHRGASRSGSLYEMAYESWRIQQQRIAWISQCTVSFWVARGMLSTCCRPALATGRSHAFGSLDIRDFHPSSTSTALPARGLHRGSFGPSRTGSHGGRRARGAPLKCFRLDLRRCSALRSRPAMCGPSSQGLVLQHRMAQTRCRSAAGALQCPPVATGSSSRVASRAFSPPLDAKAS